MSDLKDLKVDHVFNQLYKKRMLTAADMAGVATDIGISDKQKEVARNKSINVGIRLFHRTEKNQSKKVFIEAKGFLPFGISQFDPVQAVQNGWRPNKPLEADDYDEEKRKSKGWNCDVDVQKSEDFVGLQSAVRLCIKNILEDDQTQRRFGGKGRRAFKLESKSWSREKEEGESIKLGLNPQWTRCEVADEFTKQRKPVVWKDLKKNQPGWYTFKLKFDHLNVTSMDTDEQRLKLFSPIFYVQKVIYHKPVEELQREDDDKDEEFSTLEGYKLNLDKFEQDLAAAKKERIEKQMQSFKKHKSDTELKLIAEKKKREKDKDIQRQIKESVDGFTKLEKEEAEEKAKKKSIKSQIQEDFKRLDKREKSTTFEEDPSKCEYCLAGECVFHGLDEKTKELISKIPVYHVRLPPLEKKKNKRKSEDEPKTEADLDTVKKKKNRTSVDKVANSDEELLDYDDEQEQVRQIFFTRYGRDAEFNHWMKVNSWTYGGNPFHALKTPSISDTMDLGAESIDKPILKPSKHNPTRAIMDIIDSSEDCLADFCEPLQ